MAPVTPVNATAAALLGLLHGGPMTGGQLVAAAGERFGLFFSVTRSQVYRELPALTEEALLRLGLVAREGFESVHVASGALHAVRDFVSTAAEVLGLPAERLRFGARPHLAEEMWHGPVSIERLRERLGWTPPTSLREGIEATLRFADEDGG